MAKFYRPVLRDQPFLLPPDMREWLPPDHAVWLVIGAVAGLELPAVHRLRRRGGRGAAGYDPVMLATVLVWAYGQGVTSSRRVEGLCRTDVAFRVICAGDAPDHVTIARFRAGLGDAAGELFTAVLVLYARLGMGQLGTVALDGTKIAASASAGANRGEERLRELAGELAAAHAETDAAEDALFGAGVRGDEVPAELADPVTRQERIRAALAGLEAERKAAQAERDAQAAEYLDAARAGSPPPGMPPALAAVAAAEIRAGRAEAAQRDRIARREQRDARARAAGKPGYPGRRPAAPGDHAGCRAARAALDKARARASAEAAKAARQAGPGPVRNITDPASRLMGCKTGNGTRYSQGYNAQNMTSRDGLIIATEHTNSPADVTWFEPMLATAENAAALIIAHQPPGTHDTHDTHDTDSSDSSDSSEERYQGPIGQVLADAGYLSGHNLTVSGPDRLIATGKRRALEKAARSGQDDDPSANEAIAAMAARLATPAGITAYRQRGHIAETPHGHIKHNMRFRQHTMRGKTRTAAEWTLVCTVHNLFKAITTGHLTPATLAALAS